MVTINYSGTMTTGKNKNKELKITRCLVGLIGIACKYAFHALEKESILLCKNGLWCFGSVKVGKFPISF